MKQTLQDQNGQSKVKKIFGTIRRRTWTGSDGKAKSCWQADAGKIGGSRYMKSFEEKDAAKTWLWQKTIERKRFGNESFNLDASDRTDAARALDALKDRQELPKAGKLQHIAELYKECMEKLSKAGTTIQDAVTYYLDMRPTDITKRTVSEAVTEALADAKQRGLRERTLIDMRLHLEHFAKQYGSRLVTEITRSISKNYIGSIPGSPKTRAAYQRYAHGLMEFCKDHGYIPETAVNPFKALRRRKVTDGRQDEKMPEFFTPEQARKILDAAEKVAPDMIPALALGLFTGLRTSEAMTISWEQIDFGARLVRVLPAIAKGRRVRNVEMTDAALAWLLPYRKESGLLAPTGREWRTSLDQIISVSKVTWVKNGCRHSYATYHVAQFENPTKTSYELGHNSPELLFRHYRGLADKKQAEQFWKIRPQSETQVIEFKKLG